LEDSGADGFWLGSADGFCLVLANGFQLGLADGFSLGLEDGFWLGLAQQMASCFWLLGLDRKLPFGLNRWVLAGF
jgi:hypothetical protein